MPTNESLCITVRSLDRADYLKQCLDSLSQNEGIEDVHFYLLQDGAINPFSKKRYATDEGIAESIKTFEEAKLPNKTIYISDYNMQCALQKRFQLSTLFPKYDNVVLIDNDLVFNKYYIKTLRVLFDEFKYGFSGIAQTSFRHMGNNFQDEETARELENFVSYGFSHRCEIGLWRDSWYRISPHMARYFELTAECDFKELLYNPNVYQSIRKELLEIYGTEHADYAIEKSANKIGYEGIHTCTNRYKSIGERGFYSFRGSRFRDGGYDKIGLYDVGNIDRYFVLG